MRRIAVTIDCEHPDKPHFGPNDLSDVLDVVTGANLPLTFFVQGSWASARPESVKRIVDAGYGIGSHSYWHAQLPMLTDDGVRFDIGLAKDIIETVCGRPQLPLLRPPYGVADGRVRRIAAEFGYRLVDWDLDSVDWDHGQSVETFVENAFAAGSGSLLVHSWPRHTADSIGALVAAAKQHDAVFVELDEFLDSRDTPSVTRSA